MSHEAVLRDVATSSPVAGGRCVLAGKLGEFVQDHGTTRLVAVPWPCPTSAVASLDPARRGPQVEPSDRWKTQALCRLVVADFGLETAGVRVRVQSSLDASKGCGTSSAEMRAAARALAQCIGMELDPERLARHMVSIEPSDAVVSDGRVVLWNFREGTALSEELRLPEAYYVGGYPLAVELATDLVEKRRPSYSASEARAIATTIDQAVAALRSGDPEMLGAATVASAELNDRFFPKAEMALLRRLRSEGRCHGYWVAHSGVAFGLFARLDQGPGLFRELVRALGSGYRLFGFAHDAHLASLPFLAGWESLVRWPTPSQGVREMREPFGVRYEAPAVGSGRTQP